MGGERARVCVCVWGGGNIYSNVYLIEKAKKKEKKKTAIFMPTTFT